MSYKITREVEIGIVQKAGRNDPCPCGSGKKYKKCCLVKETEKTSQGVNRIRTVMDWLNKKWFVDILENNLNKIYGSSENLNSDHIKALSELSLFEGKYQGKTPLQHFVDEANLTKEDRIYYQNWIDKSFFSIFKIISVNLGQGAIIVDLIDNVEYKISERTGTYGMELGNLVAIRITPEFDSWKIGGGMFECWDTKDSQNMLKNNIKFPRQSQFEYMLLRQGRLKPNDFLYDNVEIVNDVEMFLNYADECDGIKLTEKLKQINRKSLLKLNGELTKPNRTGIDLGSYKTVFQYESDFPKIEFLRAFLTASKLIRVYENKLQITKKGILWDCKTPSEKWLQLLLSWFDDYNWGYQIYTDISVAEYQGIAIDIVKLLPTLGDSFTIAQWHEKVSLKPSQKVGEAYLEKAFFRMLVWFGILKIRNNSDIFYISDNSAKKFKYSLTAIGKTISNWQVKRVNM